MPRTRARPDKLRQDRNRISLKPASPQALSNAEIAELLALTADKMEGHVRRACLTASRAAFFWPVEASQLLLSGESLTLLNAIGPFLARQIEQWITENTRPPEPPPIRQDFLTRTKAIALLQEHPDWSKRVRGDLQMHTVWSDGAGTVAQMREAALARGYEYIAITDHSQGLKIARGIDERQLARQRLEVERLNADSPFQVLHSLEMNLNPRGEGDMDALALSELDLVIGSFHSALRLETDQTERYLAALANPDIQILAHPRGRVYNYRLGLSADWDRVFATAAELDKAVEIDAYTDRQDLNVELLKKARKAGTRISLGSDSHAPDQLAFLELGLAAALLAGIPPERILNFMPLAELKSWVNAVRGKRARRPRQRRFGVGV